MKQVTIEEKPKTTDKETTTMKSNIETNFQPGIAGCRYPKQRRPTPSLLLRSIRLLIGCTAYTKYTYYRQ